MTIRIIYIITLLLGVSVSYAQTPKQWRDSLNVLDKEISLSSDSMPLHLNRAAVNLQLSNWEDAVEDCKTVLRKDPVNLSALYYRAFAHNNLRRYNLAKNDYEDFLKLSPRNMEARLGLAYTYMQLKLYTDAMDQMNNLVEMFPDSSVVYAARAGLEQELKSYDTALYDWDKAIKREPDNKDYVTSKVDILLLSDRKKEAKAALDEAVRNGIPRGMLREWYSKCR